MNNRILVLMLLVGLMGCSSAAAKRHARYDAMVAPMKGQSADQLTKGWGPPDDTAVLPSGNKVMVYLEQRETQVKKYDFLTGSKKKVVKEYACKTTFEIGPDNQILGYSFEGNGCGSKKLKPKEQ